MHVLVDENPPIQNMSIVDNKTNTNKKQEDRATTTMESTASTLSWALKTTNPYHLRVILDITYTGMEHPLKGITVNDISQIILRTTFLHNSKRVNILTMELGNKTSIQHITLNDKQGYTSSYYLAPAIET